MKLRYITKAEQTWKHSRTNSYHLTLCGVMVRAIFGVKGSGGVKSSYNIFPM